MAALPALPSQGKRQNGSCPTIFPYCTSYKFIPKYILQRFKPKLALSALRVRWPPATLKHSHMLPDITDPIMQGSSPIPEETKRHAIACCCFLFTFLNNRIKRKKIQPQLAPVGVNNEMWLSDSWKAASMVISWPIVGPLRKRIRSTTLNEVNFKEA